MARKKKKLSAAEKKKRKDKRRRKREQLLNDFQQPKQVSGKPGLGGREYPPKEIRNAIIRAARGVAESERTPDQWYSLGSLLVYEGCLEEDDALLDQGLNALLQAAEAEPPIGLAVLDLSWVFALKGLHSMALQYAKKACTLLPDNQDAWRFCANAYVAMGMREEAIECMERASKVSEPFPRDLEYLETLKNGKPLGRCFVVSYGIQANLVEGNHNLSQEELKLLRFETKQLAKSLEDKEELTLTLAQLSWQLGDIDGALKTLAELTATNPEHANANAFLGRLYDLKRNKEQAIHHYNRALANSPDEAFLVMSLTNLAKHLLDDDEPHAARNLLEAAMTIAPDYGVAFHLYGNSVARLEGDFELELTYHEKAVELCPDKVGVLVSHLMCLMSLNRLEDLRTTFQAYKSKFTGDVGDFHFPLELMRTYLEPPEDLDGCIFFANTFLRLNPSAASRFIELAVEKCDSGNAGEYENSLGYLGMLASQAKDHELVLRIFEEAHRVSGNNIHNANSAVALAALGRVKEALEMIETCDPNEERVLTIKGNLLWDAGQLQEACLTYRQAIEVDRHYVLPYHHGFETAWRVGDLQLAREFAIELEKVQNVDDDRQTLTLGRMQRALGDPFKAVETLSGLLESRARTSAPQRSEDGLESVYLEDRELTETWKTSDSEIRYDLACSYIFARDFRSFEDLWAQRVNEPGRDWITLWAEMLRLKGRFADVVDFLTKPENELELIPPRLITKALAELSQGLQEAAVETLKQAEDFGERRWEHPLGEQAALIQGLKATAALQSGDELRATELCSEALALFPKENYSCLCLAQLSNARGDSDGALEVLAEGLDRYPGSFQLLELFVEICCENGLFDQGELMIHSCTPSLRSSGLNAEAAWLLSDLLNQKLQKVGEPGTVEFIEPGWFKNLDTKTRDWLRAAFIARDNPAGLRLASCIYLCKSAENELTRHLLDPYYQAIRESNPRGRYPNFLSKIVEAMDRRPPGLGAIYFALNPPRSNRRERSDYLSLWQKTIDRFDIRHPSFMDGLKLLKDVRNPICHIGELCEESFDRVWSFLLRDDKPGLFFQGLKITS